MRVNSGVQFPLGLQCEPQDAVYPRHFRVGGTEHLQLNPQRLVQILDRLVKLPVHTVRVAEAVVRDRERRMVGAELLHLDLQSLVVILDRLDNLSVGVIRGGEAPVRSRHRGVDGTEHLEEDLQRFLQTLDCLVRVPFLPVRVSEILVCVRATFRIGAECLQPDRERLVQALERLVELMLVLVRNAQVLLNNCDVEGIRAFEVDSHRQRTGVGGNGPIVVADTVQNGSALTDVLHQTVGPRLESALELPEQVYHPPSEHLLVDCIHFDVLPRHPALDQPPNVCQVFGHRGLGLGAVNRHHHLDQDLIPILFQNPVHQTGFLGGWRDHRDWDPVCLGRDHLKDAPGPLDHQWVVERPGHHQHLAARLDLPHKLLLQRLKRHHACPSRLIDEVLVDACQVEIVHRRRSPGRHHPLAVRDDRLEQPNRLAQPGVAHKDARLTAVPLVHQVEIGLRPLWQFGGRWLDQFGGYVGSGHYLLSLWMLCVELDQLGM
eukprot:m.229113 g.229113  ORF g.229113 m.229113 type:complete len:490 (-) comp15675_c1_seq2:291-1760(-)